MRTLWISASLLTAVVAFGVPTASAGSCHVVFSVGTLVEYECTQTQTVTSTSVGPCAAGQPGCVCVGGTCEGLVKTTQTVTEDCFYTVENGNEIVMGPCTPI